MKRNLFILAVVLSALTVCGQVCAAPEWQKASKKECKVLEKEGWKVYSKSQSLEDALQPYYEALYCDTLQMQHIVVTAQAANINTALSKARHMASREYASSQETSVEGQTTAQVVTRSEGDSIATRQRLESSTRASTRQRVRDFKPTATINRTLPDGTVEVRLYYIVKKE